MFNPHTLITTVQHNCHISDAQFAGHYTMCVFLLKMREYFRWEQGIPLSHPLPTKALGEWLLAREKNWDSLESETFSPVQIGDQQFAPFDNEGINLALIPQGYVYSGGYGLYQKPCFFLAELTRSETREDTTLLIAGKEFARDLAAPPAMLLGKTIYVRQESLRRFIWEKIEEWKQRNDPETPMGRALSFYSQHNLESVLDQVTEHELNSLILHETGETMAHKLLGRQWEELLLALPRSRAELLVRAVRDNLADCLSTLPTLIEEENAPALHFYFANFTGMRKEIFPAALDAYHHWVTSGSLTALHGTCRAGGQHWQETAKKILDLFQAQAKQLEAGIEKVCLHL